MKHLKIGVVGVGAVGREMIRLLRRRGVAPEAVTILARSARTEEIDGDAYRVLEAGPEAFEGLDVAFFAGTEGAKGASQTLGWEAVSRGCVVVDNGDDFRMDERVPLVVPEINPEALRAHRGFIANPNCSTIIGLMALAPLHRAFRIRRFVACTYQAVSGSGAAAVEELEAQVRAWAAGQPMEAAVYPHPIAFNVLAKIGGVKEVPGVPSEELKMQREAHKILGDSSIRISTTCVRVPVFNGHSEALHVEFERPADPGEARRILAEAPGVRLVDDVERDEYPMPVRASGSEKVEVGRLRRDDCFDNGLALFAAGDNLWKGAAQNAVQIAESLVEQDLMRVPSGG
jgi:aspartate-semialdehyde dehydrogenase